MCWVPGATECREWGCKSPRPLAWRSSDSHNCIWVMVSFGCLSASPFSPCALCSEFPLTCITDVMACVQLGGVWPILWATLFAEHPPDRAEPPEWGERGRTQPLPLKEPLLCWGLCSESETRQVSQPRPSGLLALSPVAPLPLPPAQTNPFQIQLRGSLSRMAACYFDSSPLPHSSGGLRPYSLLLFGILVCSGLS